LLIVNKIDLNMRLDESTILGDSVKLSAKTGKNVAILNQSIKNKLMPGSGTRDILLTRHRHIEAFEKMRSFLVKAKSALSAETMAFELYAGLDVIAELTGRVMRRDILDRIFSEFCIGK
jgi:tRNA modification GTPase